MSGIEPVGGAAQAVTELVRSVIGVGHVYTARTDLLGAVTRIALHEPSPVVLTVTDDTVHVAVEIGVSSPGTAPSTARAVADAVRAWCAERYPLLRADVAVRVAFVE